MENKPIEVIISLLKGAKNKNNSYRLEWRDENNNEIYALNNCDYLLGQVIRQYSLAWSHYFISKAARDVWESLTDDNIWNYWSSYKLKVTKPQPLGRKLKFYKGNSNKYEEKEIKTGDIVQFNDIFHDEHMVTINDVRIELLKLDNPTEEQVKALLDKLYVCRILKEEDRKIPAKKHRSLDVDEVIDKFYQGIEVIKECH